MPGKIPAHDAKKQARINKIDVVVPTALARARKYRSSSNWQKVAALHKRENPLCFDPFKVHEKEGCSVPVAETHHIYGVATHYHLRNFEKNLASLCHKCHDMLEKKERRGHKTAYLFKTRP